MSEITIDLLSEPAGVARAKAMLQRAQWAARSYATYDKASVDRIVAAVADVGASRAREFAEKAVAETGFGVVEHKVLKNIAMSTGIVETYRDHDYVSPRVDPTAKIVEVPRPAGVILALTPSTNPVATVLFNTILALMTRSVVVISPHPMAKRVCAEAARALSEAARGAGAPDGVIQVVDEPSVPLINTLMKDERTNVILATGGTPVVRSAYSSGNPALGVGPGNVPVLVDATADLVEAARLIVESKSFDHGILCTNESVLIVEEAAYANLLRHLERAGAHLLTDEERDALRETLFPDGHFNTDFVGKSAAEIASASGIRVAPNTKILLAPFDYVVPEEPLAHEKLCPVLGLVKVPSASRGIDAAKAVLRLGGQGHSASIHSSDSQTILAFGAALPVLRVSVNVGNSLGSAGVATNLAPSMTIGTGFFGRSSLVENLQPKHLLQYTKLAYNADVAVTFGNFTGLNPWLSAPQSMPPYPLASNLVAQGSIPQRSVLTPQSSDDLMSGEAEALREEVRRIVIEELRRVVRN